MLRRLHCFGWKRPPWRVPEGDRRDVERIEVGFNAEKEALHEERALFVKRMAAKRNRVVRCAGAR
jgi:hypothetical protein